VKSFFEGIVLEELELSRDGKAFLLLLLRRDSSIDHGTPVLLRRYTSHRLLEGWLR
jgi:hypothetical protein